MFVVVVTHNTGHGEASDSVLVTRSIRKAVKTARGIESLGYEFYSSETGVGIYRLKEGRPYRKEEFKWLLGENPPPTVVFYREHRENHYSHDGNGKRWQEEWFDKKLQALVDKVK